ncbi:MAG: putative cytochrome hydroxylase [Verrucomicrobiaceae bacterium]|nr:putative cytochrome hydroxylase [Verrucomicrobiaceae bacterium]
MNSVFKKADSDVLNFLDPAYLANPYPALAALRNSAPIAKGKQVPPYGDAWTVTRYADVLTVLKDARFSVEPKRLNNGKNPMERWWLPRTFRLISEGLLNKDDPDHYRLRNLVQKAFTSRLIDGMQPHIEQMTDELLANLDTSKPVDLLHEFALPLPLAVISHMLGVPDRDRMKFRELTNGIMTGAMPVGVFSMLRAAYAMHRLMRFLDYLLKLKRREPDNRLISALVAAEQAGDSLSADELLAMLFLLLFAGHETTVNLIGSGMLALLDNPEQMQLLIDKPELAASAVEELLRYTNPVQFGASRIALEDVEIGGVKIEQNSVVVAMLSSANRDEAVFPNSETLDITRESNRHLAFGFGIHFCLGAPLARMEGHIAFGKLLKRFPNIKLAVPRDQIRWRASPVFRGLESLPVILE